VAVSKSLLSHTNLRQFSEGTHNETHHSPQFVTYLSLLALIVNLIGCREEARRTAPNEEVNRPLLEIISVKADHMPPFPGQEHAAWEFPMIVLRLTNRGHTPARLTRITAKPVTTLSDNCEFKFKEDQVLNLSRRIAIGADEEFYLGVAAKAPCQVSMLLGITTEYTNEISGAEHTQDLRTSTTLVFGDEPPQKN